MDSHGLVRDSLKESRLTPIPHAFVVAKKESMLLEDGPAERASKCVCALRRLSHLGHGVSRCIQGCVLKVLKCGSVEYASARLACRRDICRTAIFCGAARPLDLHFRDALRRREHLYLRSCKTVTDSNNESGSDPKKRIATANLLYRALVDSENQRYEEAVPILEEVLKQEPNTSIAYMQLGRAYVALKQYQKAIPPLRHVVETAPDNALAHYELGCALVKTGQWNEATPQFEAAVSQLNSSSMMHFYLALVYQQTSRNDEALTEYQSALRLDTKNFPANFLLGRMYVKRQQASAALPFLKESAKLRPDAIDPHRVLADAYVQLGQEENANRELSEAERIQALGGSRLGTPTEFSTDPMPQP